MPFTIQTRADLVSAAAARALQRAGCREVWLGAESGSQRVLDAMNKGTTVAQVLAAREHQLDGAERLFRQCLDQANSQTEGEIYEGLLRVLMAKHKYKDVVTVCRDGLTITGKPHKSIG